MPIIKSAKKQARQAVKRTKKNAEIKKLIKSALKAFKAKPTPENLSKTQSEYDKAVKKGLLKKNTASRRKASLHKLAKSAGVKPATKTAKIVKAEKSSVAPKPAAEKVTKTPAKKPAATAKSEKTTKTAKKPTAPKSAPKTPSPKAKAPSK
jgi:ribosomal protein S20